MPISHALGGASAEPRPPSQALGGPPLSPAHALPAGSKASESLLARARCYGILGQKKTSMLDFNAVLRAEPENVPALCGRALVHLALGQQQVLDPRPRPSGDGLAGRRPTPSGTGPAKPSSGAPTGAPDHEPRLHCLFPSRILVHGVSGTPFRAPAPGCSGCRTRCVGRSRRGLGRLQGSPGSWAVQAVQAAAHAHPGGEY